MLDAPVESDVDRIARLAKGLVRYLRCLGVPEADAPDMAQEALLKAFSAGAEPAAQQAAWLRTAARRLWLDELRKRGRRPEIVDLEAVERAFARCEGDDEGLGYRTALEACLEGLAARERRALELRYGERALRGAIGRELGIGEDGVKGLLRRVRARLKACIEKRRNEP
jgi:RNA polymerase sigma factor (sigma-70 family)